MSRSVAILQHLRRSAQNLSKKSSSGRGTNSIFLTQHLYARMLGIYAVRTLISHSYIRLTQYSRTLVFRALVKAPFSCKVMLSFFSSESSSRTFSSLHCFLWPQMRFLLREVKDGDRETSTCYTHTFGGQYRNIYYIYWVSIKYSWSSGMCKYVLQGSPKSERF